MKILFTLLTLFILNAHAADDAQCITKDLSYIKDLKYTMDKAYFSKDRIKLFGSTCDGRVILYDVIFDACSYESPLEYMSCIAYDDQAHELLVCAAREEKKEIKVEDYQWHNAAGYPVTVYKKITHISHRPCVVNVKDGSQEVLYENPENWHFRHFKALWNKQKDRLLVVDPHCLYVVGRHDGVSKVFDVNRSCMDDFKSAEYNSDETELLVTGAQSVWLLDIAKDSWKQIFKADHHYDFPLHATYNHDSSELLIRTPSQVLWYGKKLAWLHSIYRIANAGSVIGRIKAACFHKTKPDDVVILTDEFHDKQLLMMNSCGSMKVVVPFACDGYISNDDVVASADGNKYIVSTRFVATLVDLIKKTSRVIHTGNAIAGAAFDDKDSKVSIVDGNKLITLLLSK